MELSEEEKKALEILKEIKDVRGIRQDVEGENEDLCALDIVYKLIEKQQKDYISKDKIRERIKHNEEQRNIVVSVAKFKIDNDGITGEGIEGLNDLIVYKSYEAVINELNYLLKE